MTRTSSLLLLLSSPVFAVAGGCSPLALSQVTDYEVIGESESDSTSSASSSSPGTTSETDSGDSNGSSEGTTGGITTGLTDTETATGTTTGESLLPPTIVDVALTPGPIVLFNGPLTVTVLAEDTDGVRLEFGAEQAQGLTLLELEEVDAGVFRAEIPVLTGLDNGDEHLATLTPWSAEFDEGEPVEFSYAIQLPELGTEGYWETGKAAGTGPGQVRAIANLPGGDAVEFGMAGDGTSGCRLIRRDKGGSLVEQIELFPGVECKAIDMEIGDDGAIYVLMSRYVNGDWYWFLVEMPSWGEELKSRGQGNIDEVADALAEHDGMLAVCGAAPTIFPDDLTDAMVKIFRPNLPGQSQMFDHVPEGEKEHSFSERARGCDFRDDETLVVVGEGYGKHQGAKTDHNRRFDLAYDLPKNSGELAFMDSGLALQSFATDVDVDAAGRAMIVGYLCDEVCIPEGRAWMLDAEGTEAWETSTGLHAAEAFAPNAVRWTPAGDSVITSGGLKGDETAFLVRAYAPFNSEPLWTYSRKDPDLLNLALTVAIGTFGEIYCGGFGANGYPAFAIVFG